MVGRLDRRLHERSLAVRFKTDTVLDVLVENGGRLNFRYDFIFDRKGIVGAVTIGGQTLENWQIYNLPLDNLSGLKFTKEAAKPNTPTFYRGSFELKNVGDTFWIRRLGAKATFGSTGIISDVFGKSDPNRRSLFRQVF